jgi:hypothetical protein
MPTGDDRPDPVRPTKPRLNRPAILAVILVCWLGGLAAMVRRQAADHTDARRLAAAAARVTPLDVYFNVEQNGAQIGFAASRLDTLDGGFYLADYLLADRIVTIPTPRGFQRKPRRTTLVSRVWLSNTFALRRYIAISDTGAGETTIQIDPVGDSALSIAVSPPPGQGGKYRVDTVPGNRLTLAPSLIPLALALGGTTPRVGTHTRFDELDPVDGPRRVTMAVAGDSLFAVPDSAVYDSAAHQWTRFSSDTLRAWRIVPDSPLIGGGTPIIEWIDDQGRLVSAAGTVPATGPVTLVRTTYELAHENWAGKYNFVRAAAK